MGVDPALFLSNSFSSLCAFRSFNRYTTSPFADIRRCSIALPIRSVKRMRIISFIYYCNNESCHKLATHADTAPLSLGVTAYTSPEVGLRARDDVECSTLSAPIPAQPQLSSEVVFNQCREGRRLRAPVAREKPYLASPLRFLPCIGVYIPVTQTLTNQ